MARKAFHVLIASVALSALLGIIALMSSEFGKTEGKILLTTLCVAGASVLAMASSAAWERGVGRFHAGVGLAAALLGGVLTLIGLWSEVDERDFWRFVGSLVVLAAVGAHGAGVFLARLAPRYRWIRPATLLVAAILAFLIFILIWDGLRGDTSWRVMGILAILTGAGTIILAVLQRMSRDARDDSASPPTVCCPHCGEELPPELLGH